MKNAFNLLAASPILAQIVPENKGEVLSVQDSSQENALLLLVLALIIASMLLFFVTVMRHRHRKRHYRAR